MSGGFMSAEDLARRAIACEGWRWMPGMLSAGPCGGRVWGVTYTFPADDAAFGPWLWLDNDAGGARDGRAAPDHFPDLTDPATLGCLLALVREAWGDPHVSCFAGKSPAMPRHRWTVSPRPDNGRISAEDTEAAALVAALEAAL